MGYLYALKSEIVQDGQNAFERSVKSTWPNAEIEYGTYKELMGGPYIAINTNDSSVTTGSTIKYGNIILNKTESLTPSTYITISNNEGFTESDKITLEPVTEKAEEVTDLNLGGLYTEIGHNVDLSQYVSGWSVNSFCNYLPALQSGSVTDAKSYYNNVQSVKNGYITNTNLNAAFMKATRLTEFTANLDNLYDAAYAFAGTSYLRYWTVDLPSLVIGHQMFFGGTIASWKGALPNLDRADQMFYGCLMGKWETNLPKLTNGSRMFHTCSRLTTVTAETPMLSNANSMFQNCIVLTSCDIDYSNITECATMFGTTRAFTTFNHNLPKCTKCYSMFYKSGITSFESVMPLMVQDGATDGSDVGDGTVNKGFWKMFEQAASLNSVIITTNATAADYVNATNLYLRSTAAWTRTTETLSNGLVKVTLTAA